GPPRRPDTGYFPAAVPAGAPVAGRRNNALLTGVLVGLGLLLVIGGVGAWLLLGDHTRGGGGGTTGGAGTGQPATSAAGPTTAGYVDVGCDNLFNQSSS